MQLYLRVPIFTSQQEELDRRKTALDRWWTAEGLPRLQERYRFSVAHVIGLAPGQSVAMVQESEDNILVAYPDRPGALVPKGILVRLELAAVLDWVDRTDARHRDDAYFVMIDGSGAFDFGNLFLILDKLVGAPRADVVLGSRPKNHTGMPVWRRAIEHFEEHLLLEQHRDAVTGVEGAEELWDGQAGCWGLCLSALRSIALTARGYELEYDLVASTLKNGLPFRFAGPLAMQVRGASEFGGEVSEKAISNSIQKLKFILHKLAITSEVAVDGMESYVRTTREPDRILPTEYVTAVRREFRHRRVVA